MWHRHRWTDWQLVEVRLTYLLGGTHDATKQMCVCTRCGKRKLKSL